MSFSIIATVGGNNSNSFVTIAESDEIIDASPYPTDTWEALDDDAKAFRLILACKYMTGRYAYKGCVLHQNQALPFPRYYRALLTQRHGIFEGWVDSLETGTASILGYTTAELDALDVIPYEVKTAQVYIAYGVIHRGMVGITNPALGGKAKPQVKELNLFNRLKIVAADSKLTMPDWSPFAAMIQSETFIIDLLLEDWKTQVSMISGGDSKGLVSMLTEVVGVAESA